MRHAPPAAIRPLSAALVAAVLATLVVASPARADTLLDTPVAASPTLAPLSWGRLQGRLAFATTATPLRSDFQGSETAFKVSSLSLMGDYYLRPSLSQLTLGGLRATSGLVFGQRSALWGMSSGGIAGFSVDRRNQAGFDGINGQHGDHLATTPYFGIGYTGTGASVGKAGSWGFTADLGVMSLSPGTSNRFGRGTPGTPNLDDMVRDLRFSPVLQFGFSYSF